MVTEGKTSSSEIKLMNPQFYETRENTIVKTCITNKLN